MSKKIVLLFILISSYAFSQSVNDYQYVIVPVKFKIFKENDKYRLNSTIRLLLEKYGFKTFLSSDEIPSELGDNCKRLYADLVKESDFMTTKVKVVLKDCRERVVFETYYGKSREKEYVIAYNQALREAGKSFDKLNYKYNGRNDIQVDAEKPILNEKNSSTIQDNEIEIGESKVISTNQLVAETIENGFLLIDSTTSTIVLKLFKTSNESVFIATSKTINGVVIKKGKDSFFEYYKDKKLVSEKLNVCCI